MIRSYYSFLIAMLVCFSFPANAQQITVNRIEQMPNNPLPFQMRNWKQVAREYDSLVFNFSLTGNFLPLVWINNSTVNYPGQSSFGLHTYVGTNSPSSAEAINCLPAVISASLAGIDKSNQNGYDWVRMCQEWFNNRPAENVYLNQPVASSGDDWWYDVMPNVFFSQLSDLYPNEGDFPRQDTLVAGRWMSAIYAMGAGTTPWSIANVDHRAWYLSTMTPNDNGVKEPEAAGAIAWILYHEFAKTDNPTYRIAAELSMESLDAYTTNPSYELQMAYGAYTAARMNAELGTTYDVPKMVNWCFEVGPLRSWGAIVGKWGGYDCSGLIGEVNYSNDYAFCMNTFEQIGALVPLVRYDPRFARAIGKWVLNAANASRLFYANQLPDQNQDSAQWSHQFDPNSSIAHEAMHQFNPTNSSISPFATGDAIGGGWASTNFSLYSSSHAGILGAIIDTTDVPGILRLNVLATDYHHDKSFPTYLYFNPDSVLHIVHLDAGSGQHDIYDGVSKSFLVKGSTGLTGITIPSNSAVLAVLTPSNGTTTYDEEKMLVNDTVVDYHSGNLVANHAPRIKSLSVRNTTVRTDSSVRVYCTAVDIDHDTLSYNWFASSGIINGAASSVIWTAPDSQAVCTVKCTVLDGHGGQAADSVIISVVKIINHSPVIQKFNAIPRKIDLNSSSLISCIAADPDSNALSYTWHSTYGSVSGVGSSVTWTAPGVAGNYFVSCTVDDGQGGVVIDSIGIEVRDFSIVQTGELAAYYTFSGNANDVSGHNHSGSVSAATLVNDRFGVPNAAYSFNGTSSFIQVPNDSLLNFQNAISLNFWMKVKGFYSGREQYPISHGNWTNRWKISIQNPSNNIRWTVKTNTGVKDLDSETKLMLDSLYYISAIYSGSDMELYINGQLDAFTTFSGSIAQTNIDLTIGRTLPTDATYSFNGVLDEIRLYNYALSVAQVESLYSVITGIKEMSHQSLPHQFLLHQNYPNPFNPTTILRFEIPVQSFVSLKIYDVLGREVATAVEKELMPGRYETAFDGNALSSGVYFYRLAAGPFRETKKLLLLR